MMQGIIKLVGAFVLSMLLASTFSGTFDENPKPGSTLAFVVLTLGFFGIFLMAFRATFGGFELSSVEKQGCFISVIVILIVTGVVLASGGGGAGAAFAVVGGLAVAASAFGYLSAFSALFGGRQRAETVPPVAPRARPHEIAEEDLRPFHFDPSRFYRQEYPDPPQEDLLRLGYHPAPGAYSTNEAIRMFGISGAGAHPGHTRSAEALAACCLQAMGRKRGMAFLNEAARDRKLPTQIGQLYNHALQVAERQGGR